jgi:hypothetical protein
VGDGCVTMHMKIELENLISKKSYFQLQVRDRIFWCCNFETPNRWRSKVGSADRRGLSACAVKIGRAQFELEWG